MTCTFFSFFCYFHSDILFLICFVFVSTMLIYSSVALLDELPVGSDGQCGNALIDTCKFK